MDEANRLGKYLQCKNSTNELGTKNINIKKHQASIKKNEQYRKREGFCVPLAFRHRWKKCWPPCNNNPVDQSASVWLILKSDLTKNCGEGRLHVLAFLEICHFLSSLDINREENRLWGTGGAGHKATHSQILIWKGLFKRANAASLQSKQRFGSMGLTIVLDQSICIRVGQP